MQMKNRIAAIIVTAIALVSCAQGSKAPRLQTTMSVPTFGRHVMTIRSPTN